MTSPKQFEANGRNALLSTGPKSAQGKRRSRCNALRHGLAAETIVEAFEDPKHYKKFQAAIVSDYAPQSTVEHELVLRAASLLWRLRRATLVETGLLEIQATTPPPRPSECSLAAENRAELYRLFSLPNIFVPSGNDASASSEVARCYLRLNNLENAAFDRLGHYEARLWWQLVQALVMLDLMKRPVPLARSGRSRRVSKIRASYDQFRLTRFD